MRNLTNADKKLIRENGGILSKDEQKIRFRKTNKPDRECKRRLRELGYEITNESGAPYRMDMEYVLRKQA